MTDERGGGGPAATHKAHESDPTFFEENDLGRARRGRWLRRLFFVALVGLLVAGALNLLGVRTGTVSAQAAGYEIVVTYAKVTRPGLATPWTVEITREGGFPTGVVTVATTSKYFDLFDENSVDPEPVESVSDGDQTIWGFQAPRGDTMTVSLDARIEPGTQLDHPEATTSILVDGTPVVSVPYRPSVPP